MPRVPGNLYRTRAPQAFAEPFDLFDQFEHQRRACEVDAEILLQAPCLARAQQED